jgi:glycosyltransferase involved in cell wall biosynthesis
MEKGLFDLVAAVRNLEPPVELLLVGDGPLRKTLQSVDAGSARVHIITDLPHERMAEAYGRMDVLALPSRTTPRWAEQFGRVLVEALWCGVPVIGSQSGEIPWVIESTGGGLTFPEGDVDALRGCLEAMRADPALRARLATLGREQVERMFSVEAVARRFAEQLAVIDQERSALGISK